MDEALYRPPRTTVPDPFGPPRERVAIVGGGMTDALLGHAFASAGVVTTLLKADVIGRGSTTASSALLLQEPDMELLHLERWQGVHSENHALFAFDWLRRRP